MKDFKHFSKYAGCISLIVSLGVYYMFQISFIMWYTCLHRKHWDILQSHLSRYQQIHWYKRQPICTTLTMLMLNSKRRRLAQRESKYGMRIAFVFCEPFKKCFQAGVLQMANHAYGYFCISHRANNLCLCVSDGPEYRYGELILASVTFSTKSVLYTVFQFLCQVALIG